MPGGPVAAQLDEQPLIVEHDTREDANQPILPDESATRVTKSERTPLPWKPLIVLTALNAVCPLAFELIYPFVNSMIVEIGVTHDPERVGFYSGLIESVFSVTSLIMIIPCGYVSDHIGRKPVVLLGLGGLSVSIVSFGLSKSLAGMIASRCIGGALGASWAAIKVMTLPSKVKARRKAKRTPCSSGSSTPPENTPLLVNELETNQASKKPTWRTVMTPSIFSLVVNNACMCIASEMLFSVYPLFAFTPITSGGLGMSEGEIGTQMSVTMAFWSLVVLGFPFLHWVASHTGIKSAVFNLAQFIFFLTWSICGFAWVCMGTMVNDASPSAEALSISQMSIVLPQAISPALANSLFAASVEKHILGGNLVWVLLFLFTCLAFVHSLTLKEHEDDWRTKQDEHDD
ncbi:unnamed protein product [Rhizoctonia solani]|uniref:Major facilitator superfamily (MFS) profile domain-containing protein n=1 Tax=Rhizoctonia solani TaxID=456999 RepID=A0A8H3I1L8_9AGAM|nr:unnamed protein product [Rhizoctonia solani]